MTKQRAGYRTLTLQLPEILCEIIDRIAAEKRSSFTAVITEGLCRLHKVPLSKLPPRKKPGRKPKREGR